MTIFDFGDAKVDLRRAVTLEPARDKAWELLFISAVSTDELVSICESLVKCKNSARNHLLLAKALIKQNRLGDAALQTKRAAELDHDNPLPCWWQEA